jgi:NAD-specific glutamate dehydrogenase
METTPRRIWTKVCPHCSKKQHRCRCTIKTTVERDDDEKLYVAEEGLVLSRSMCAVEHSEAIVMSETKEELVMNMMNIDEMELEEFPMIPEIIAREQKKDTQLK